jgi:hypothetical protein
MSATSTLSFGSERLEAWTRRSQPIIEIDLTGPKPGHVNCYTTADSIDGTVTVTVEHETPFDEVEIVFDGIIPINSRYMKTCH